jgi:hypothetical protein
MPPLIAEALQRLPDHELALRAQLLARQAEGLNLSPQGYEAEGRARLSMQLADQSGDPAAIARSRYAYALSIWGTLRYKLSWGEFLLDAQRAAETAVETHLALLLRGLMVTHVLESGEVERSAALAMVFEDDSQALSLPFGVYLMKLRAAALAIFRGESKSSARVTEAFQLGSKIVPDVAQHMAIGQQALMTWEACPRKLAAGPLPTPLPRTA